MRRLVLSALAFGLGACGIKQYLPERPAVGARAYERDYGVLSTATVAYTSPPGSGPPVLPLQAWGVAYDLDLVIVSTHPDYQMHEYARVRTPSGPLWLAKDALTATRQQSIVADLPELDALLPELPVPRASGPVEVVDSGDERWLNLAIHYRSFRGEDVRVQYEGRVPHTRQRKRNGSTMGHSADIVMAALDLPLRDFARSALVTIDGVPYRTDRLLGIKPFQMALVQTQGGLAIADMTLSGDDASFLVTYRTRAGGEQTLAWTMTGDGPIAHAVQTQPLRTLDYTFLRRDGGLELSELTVRQWGRVEAATHVAIQPALPDLRRRFEGHARSRFVLDIEGRRGHATGELDAWWEGDQVFVAATPLAPWWFADRPMRTTVNFDHGAAHVKIERVGMTP